jgi:hypothetical protein
MRGIRFIWRITSSLLAAIALIIGISGAGIAHASPGSARASGGAPSTGRESAATGAAACSFFPHVTACASTNPKVSVEWTNFSDTTGCTFDYTIAWGDGTPDASGTKAGGPAGTALLAGHAYSSPGSYDISLTGDVSSGGCTFDPASAQFTYQRAPVAACDFYWAVPAHQLRIPAALGILGNDTDSQGLHFKATVTKINFGVSSHPYSVNLRTGSFTLQPGKTGRTLVVTYIITDTAGLRSAPAQVRILVRQKKPSASAAGKCSAPQFPGWKAPFSSTMPNPPVTDYAPKKNFEGGTERVCGISRFNWWSIAGNSLLIKRGTDRCVYLFSNLDSIDLIDLAVATNNTVSTIITDIVKGYAAANIPDGHVGSGLEEVFIQPLLDKLNPAKFPDQAIDGVKARLVGALGEIAEQAYGMYESAQGLIPIAKFAASIFEGAVTDGIIIKGDGCLEFQIGSNGKALGSQIFAVNNASSPLGTSHPTSAIARVFNSKGDAFRTNLGCDAQGFAKIRYTGNTSNVFSSSALARTNP